MHAIDSYAGTLVVELLLIHYTTLAASHKDLTPHVSRALNSAHALGTTGFGLQNAHTTKHPQVLVISNEVLVRQLIEKCVV